MSCIKDRQWPLNEMSPTNALRAGLQSTGPWCVEKSESQCVRECVRSVMEGGREWRSVCEEAGVWWQAPVWVRGCCLHGGE